MDGRATHIDRCILGIQYRRRCNYAGNHITVGGIGRVQGRVCNPFGIIAAGIAALQPPMREGERPNGGNLAACLDFIYHCICVSVHRGNPWLWLDGKRHDGIVQCDGSGVFSGRGGGAA